MSMRQVQNIHVQTEFQNGKTGDCTEDAADSALAAAYPSQYPVTGAELLTLTNAAIAAGQTEGAMGSMNPGNLAWLLTHLGVPFHQLVTPDWSNYAAFTTWQQEGRTWGGIKPMVVQLAHGEWLPGSWSNPNGPAIGHAVAWLGYDPATGDVLLGDGNSSYGGNGQPTVCPWATLMRALPYALTVLDVEVPATGGGGNGTVATPLDGYFTISSDGKTCTLKSDPRIVLSGGELALFQQLNGAIGLPIEPMVYSAALRAKYHDDPSLAFRRYERAVVVYDPNHVKDSQPGMGAFYLGHIADPDFAVEGAAISAAVASATQALQTQLSQAQTALAAAQDADAQDKRALATTGGNLASAEAALSQAQSQAQAAQAAAAALQAQVSTLQAQLAAAQASAPTPAESDAAAAVVALAKALKDVSA